ncbi:hypothetical protein ACFV0Z_20150 [Streptomyces xiamenensis]|uniref:hypothetical protein n=1 Tax=Streptomyces xiamenensis TaxID=408015 RepID=UPI0036C6F519
MEDADGYWHTYQGDSAAEQQLQAMTHQQLAALLAGANPQALIDRGAALELAAETADWVGEQIWRRANELEWEGRTAEEFRSWVKDFRLESGALKTYATLVSTAITRAGEALRQAQSEIPPVREVSMTATPEQASQEMFRTGGPMVTPLEAEADRQEAVAVLRRLASVYQLSTWTIQDAPEPQFRAFGETPEFPVDTSPGSPSGSRNPPAGHVWPSGTSDTPQETGTVPVARTGGQPTRPTAGPDATSNPVLGVEGGGVGTSLDSVGVVPNGGVPPVAPPGSPPPLVVERPVGGGPVQQPVVGPVPGWPSPAQPGQGPGRGGQVPPVRGPGLRPGETLPVRPLGPPSGPGSQPPAMGRPAPGMPGGQQPPVGRPPTGGGGPGSGSGGGNPWGRANNYGLLGGKPVPNAKPTVASRIPPGGVIQPGMNAANSRLTPTRNDQPNAPRGTYGKATVDGRPTTGRGERGRSLPKPTGVIGLPGQGRKNGKKKKKKNESKDDRQQP